MVITDITQQLNIDGEYYKLFMDGSWRSSADEDNSGGAGELYPQLWVPWDFYERLDFTSNILVKEYGLKFMFFSKVVIKTNWIWVVILVIVTIVVCVSGYLSAFCPAMVGIIGTTLGVSVVVAVIIYVAVMVAIQLILTEIASNIDDPKLRALFMIVVQIVMFMIGNYNGALSNPAGYLMFAAQITTILYSAYIEIEMKKLTDLRALREHNERIEDEIEAANEGSGLWKVDMTSHYSHVDAGSPDAMYSRTGNMFNYDQFYDVDAAINMRVNVVPG